MFLSTSTCRHFNLTVGLPACVKRKFFVLRFEFVNVTTSCVVSSRFLKDTTVLHLLLGSHAGKHQRELSQDRMKALGSFCLNVCFGYWLVNFLIHNVPSSRPEFMLQLHV